MEVVLLISLIFAVIGIIYYKEDRNQAEKRLEEYKIKNTELEIKRLKVENKNITTIISLNREIIELKQYLKAVLYKIKNNKIEINENDKTINTEGREIEITRYPEMKKEQLKLLNNVKKI